jgi:hypothetical protein
MLNIILMETTIKEINIYNDGVIEMIVKCSSCHNLNRHTITHASTKYNNKITVDFSKLGKRCCDNHGKIVNGEVDVTSICYSEYKLY